MKRTSIILLIAVFITLCPVKAQINYNNIGVTLSQVLDTIGNYAAATEDSSEGGFLVQSKVLQAFWSPWVGENEDSTINMFGLYYKAINEAAQARYAGSCDLYLQFPSCQK